MVIVLCPGVHPPKATESFRRRFTPIHNSSCLVIPETIAPYNGHEITQFVCAHCDQTEPLLWMGFSAGAVGALYAAQALHHQGRTIAALWLWDGWGVPLLGTPFPTVRISHDAFTHESSALLGGADHHFWADPAVPHLELWRNPDRVVGWQDQGWGLKARSTLLSFSQTVLWQR